MNALDSEIGGSCVATDQDSLRITVVSPDDQFKETSHGFARAWGVSGKLSGSIAISMAYGKLPGKSVASAHRHEFETGIYIVAGRVRVFFGDALRDFEDVKAGDFLTIPAGLTHGPVNMWDELLVYIVARATPVED